MPPNVQRQKDGPRQTSIEPRGLAFLGGATGGGIGSWIDVFSRSRAYDFNFPITGTCLFLGALASWAVLRWIGRRQTGDNGPATGP